MLGFGFVPVTLAVHRVGSIEVHSEFVLDRALTTALALPPSGPEIAANEWVDDFDLGLDGDRDVWAGVVRGADRGGRGRGPGRGRGGAGLLYRGSRRAAHRWPRRAARAAAGPVMVPLAGPP